MGKIKVILWTKDYVGVLIKRVRVYTNDPHNAETIVGVKAFVKAPIYVSPSYASFYSPKNRGEKYLPSHSSEKRKAIR